MDKYKIIKLDNDTAYSYLVVLCSSESPYLYLEEIADELKSKQQTEKILLDQILHVGNNDKRFLEFQFSNKRLIDAKFVNIKKGSIYRVKSCDYLRNYDVLENTILTSIQYRMISKGIVI